jgi:osmotically-inducible protein OsmY
MKRTFLGFIAFLCLFWTAAAYGQAVKDLTGAVKDRATAAATTKAAAVVDDSAITAEVKLKLADAPSLKDCPLSVTTTNGVVALTGVVKTKQAKGAATKIAKGVKGVKSITNEITIEKTARKTKADKGK